MHEEVIKVTLFRVTDRQTYCALGVARLTLTKGCLLQGQMLKTNMSDHLVLSQVHDHTAERIVKDRQCLSLSHWESRLVSVRQMPRTEKLN